MVGNKRTGLQRLVACAIASALVVAPGPAAAYRTSGDQPRFQTQRPVNWASSQIEYRINNQLPSAIAADEMVATMARATEAWSAPACSGLQFLTKGVTAAPAAPGDHMNTVQWLFSGWEEHGFPPDSPGATDLLYEKGADGRWRIVEADLYLNATSHDWVLEGPVSRDQWDLLSVLTHELGHVAGLAHPCELEGTPGAPICDSPASPAEVTMYPLYAAEQSTLADDDIDGICFLYPASDCGSSCPSNMFCSADGCVPRCGDAICGKDQTCQDGVCALPSQMSPTPSDRDPSSSIACDSDKDCEPESGCVAGRCLRRSAPGDPCSTAADCATARCDDDGTCASECSSDQECPSGSACKSQSSGGKVCIGGALPFGATCSNADDCVGRQCLEGLTPEPTCTRLCGEDLPQAPSCPAGWSCSLIKERHVCTPPRHVEAGCKAVPGSPGSCLPLAALMVLLLVGGDRRKRRVRWPVNEG